MMDVRELLYRVANLRPLLIGAAAAVLAYHLIVWAARKAMKPAQKRLAAFSGETTTAETVVFGSKRHRVRVAFQRLGIDVKGWETAAVWAGRVIAGLGFVAALRMVGLSWMVSASGVVAGALFFDGWVTEQWRTMQNQIEDEIPMFLLRMNAVVKTTPNIAVALEEVSKTLVPKKPLRAWVERLARALQQRGRKALAEAQEEAMVLSPSLGVVVVLLGRLAETGGSGFADAFGQAADSLSDVLDARVTARAKGASAQGTLFILAGVTLLMMVGMTNGGYANSPVIQTMFAVSIVWMTVGMIVVKKMLQEAV